MNRVRQFAVCVLLCITSLAFAQVKPEDAAKIEAAAPAAASAKPVKPRRVLAFTRATGYKHASIPYTAAAIAEMGKKTGAFETVISDDLSLFAPDSLAQFDAVALCNTTGQWIKPTDEDVKKLGAADKDAAEALLKKSLLDFVSGGKGLVGFHSATDANSQWPEFTKMIGGLFHGHPWHEKIGVTIEEPGHPLSRAFSGATGFDITDEIYQFGNEYTRSDRRVLLSMDTSRTNMNKGGIARHDGDFAIAWAKSYGEGRVFYSSLGHREEIWWNPTIMAFYLDGIQWALGDLKADASPRAETKAAAIDMGDPGKWDFKEGGWKFENGEMSLQPNGGYLWTKDTYGDFELSLEVMTTKGCNSGVFFRTDPKDPVQHGFEIQVLDSFGKDHADKHDFGALYDAMAPTANVVKQPGEWNTMVIRAKGPIVTVTANGQKILEVNLDEWATAHKNPDGSDNKFNTALKDLPRTGHIGYQDHGHAVSYRNVTIKPLP